MFVTRINMATWVREKICEECASGELNHLPCHWYGKIAEVLENPIGTLYCPQTIDFAFSRAERDTLSWVPILNEIGLCVCSYLDRAVTNDNVNQFDSDFTNRWA